MAEKHYKKLFDLHFTTVLSLPQKVSIFLHDLEHEILNLITGKKEYFDQLNWLKDNQITVIRSQKTGFVPKVIISDIENLKNWRNEGVHENNMPDLKYKNHLYTMAQTIKFFSNIEWPDTINNIFNYSQEENTQYNPETKIKKTKKKEKIKMTRLNYSIQKLSWEMFVEKVINEKYYIKRIEVIKIAKGLFEKYEKFSDMLLDDRKFLAGIPNKLNEDISEARYWALFGSMKGAGKYKKEIIENNKNISIALEQIPFSGNVVKENYLKFWEYYGKNFSDTSIATATRLLCMKRPDTFICLDSQNKSKLCENFGIKKYDINKDFYWDEITIRITNSEWWTNTNPKNEEENIIRDARAAFLDSLLYEGKITS